MDDEGPIVVGEDAIEFPASTEHVDENGNTIITGYQGGGAIPLQADPPPVVNPDEQIIPEGA